MPANPYDQACRYLLRMWAASLLAWLLRLTPEQLDFVGWLDARQVVWPGQPDRTCDTVAHLRDPHRGCLPWAAVVEFQIVPDELMFGRGLGYLGDLWLALKPTKHKGDRFEVGLVVVNLTGRGSASRRMRLTKTRLQTVLRVEDRNLAALSANRVLKQVETGEAPGALLAWIPLFKGGDRPGIIAEWRRLAKQENDPVRRQALGLTVVFAEATGCGPLWRESLKEWDMIESQIVKEWQTQAELKGKRQMLLRLLNLRFKSVPQELVTGVEDCTDPGRLDAWGDVLITARSLKKFRLETGL